MLAVARAARNLVLLGDPQQLAQPSHATHPPGAGASAIRVSCRTPHQMVLANALCRAWETGG